MFSFKISMKFYNFQKVLKNQDFRKQTKFVHFFLYQF